MKRTFQLFSLLAIAALLLCLPGKLSITAKALAQDKTPLAPAAPSAPSGQDKTPATPSTLPTPEMQRLAKFYVGTWDYTETYPKSAFSPQGGQNTGVYTSELGPGGNSLVNHFHSRGQVGDFEAILVMTWDPKEKAYKQYLFGNDFPGAVIETGQWEGDTLVYRGEFSADGMKFALRNATKLTAPGKISSEEFSSTNGAPETLLVNIAATKRP
jgi:hypothetical protein